VCLGFGALTVLLTFPLAFSLGSIGRADNGDGQFSIWNVAWVARTLVVDPRHVFDANIFYPHRWTLAYSENNLGAGALAIPVYWATRNPYAAHNFVFLLSFVLSAAGAYYLVRYLTGDRSAAVVSAIAFAFCPYVFAHTPHIQLLMTAGLPFSMLAFHRLADEPTPGRGAVLGLAMAAQALFCGYYSIFVMLMVGWAVMVTAATGGRWTDRRYWTAVSVGAALAIGVTMPLAMPYWALRHEAGFTRSVESARQWSADWRAYLASSAYAHAWLLRVIGHWNEVLFPGFAALILGLTGAGIGWRARGRAREITMLYATIALLALWASFGPEAGLYRALYSVVPGFGMLRAPSRFGIVVVFALCVLSGAAVASWMARLQRRTGPAHDSPGRAPGRPSVVSFVLVAAVVMELAVPLTFPPVPPVNPVYPILARLPRGAVLETPVFSSRFAFVRTQYMLSSTAHWKPLVNAYSDYTPQDFLDKVDALGGFPSPESFAILQRDGVKYVVVHWESYNPIARAELEKRLKVFAPYLVRCYDDGKTVLYEIAAFPSNPKP
jgi:hypothetical protein